MDASAPTATTGTRAPAPSDAFSLSVGADGPLLLHDHHFISQMAHFNRERVPERDVHAKGGGAFGFFEVTDDVSGFTKAAVFQPGTRTGTLPRIDRNPATFFAEIEQAAFEPSALVPGIGIAPDKMLLGRMFAYGDAHRYRIGPNYLQLPVNQPKVPVHTYTFDGAMRHEHTGAQPVCSPNSYGGPVADPVRGEDHGWHADGEMVRSAYTLRAEDDDFGQPGTLVRDVMDDHARARLVGNVVGHLSAGGSRPVLERAVAYWRSVDKAVGDRIATRVGLDQAA